MSNEAGTLYIVATPIGNLQDFSQRAVEVLSRVGLIAAEDTRHSSKLLHHYRIDSPLVSLHEHNEVARTPELLDRLRQGDSIAIISDAGTPLISDPGYRSVRAAHAAGIRVVPIPGPCAVTAALSAAGLPTDRFVFEGFLAPKSGQRRKVLRRLATEERTLVLYESNHRIAASLRDMADCLGHERQAVLARELTKVYETIRGGTLAELSTWLESVDGHRKGELVVIVEGMAGGPGAHEVKAEIDRVLGVLLQELPLKSAVKLAAEITGLSKNRIYEQALTMQKDS